MKSNFNQKFLIGVSFISLILTVVCFFFFIMNVGGAATDGSVSDWTKYFAYSMVISLVVFLITNLSEEVRNFWKNI